VEAEAGFDLGLLGGVVVDASGRAPRRANVYVRDGRVADVSVETRAARRTVDCDGLLVMPGLVNLHVHARPGRALGDGLPMLVWHERWADGLARAMRDGDAYVGALLAFTECLLGGTTSALVMTPRYLEAADAARDVGIRAIVVPLAVDDETAAGTGDDLQESIATITSLGRQEGERVQVWFGFDSTYSTSERGIRAVAASARAVPLGVHTHLSEEREDARLRLGTKGLFGVHYLHDCGLLDLEQPVVLAHCNWLDDDEIELLAAARALTVAHNPTSNMHLGTGVCPVGRLRGAGVRIGLGSDGMLSNFHLDMFQVMRGACMLQRISALDAGALSSIDAFELATVGGGRVFAERLGEVAPGAPADLVVVDPRHPRLSPTVESGTDANIVALLVWCAAPSDVRTVVVDGRIVVDDGRLCAVREDEVVARAQETFDRIYARIDSKQP
jgi:5-methylthioadenosine/S-adenosylhomocysteine deaminase